MFQRIKDWYATGKWSEPQVQAAVAKGWITQAQADEITADVDV